MSRGIRGGHAGCSKVMECIDTDAHRSEKLQSEAMLSVSAMNGGIESRSPLLQKDDFVPVLSFYQGAMRRHHRKV